MTGEKPRVSIVIPSHHRADLLSACLHSVLAHSPPGVEIIVVDDASPGGVATTAARQFARVVVVAQAQRRGFCAAVNLGLAHAQAPIVQLLNDDAQVLPGWIDAALAAFAEPRVAAVAPLVLLGPRGDVIDSAGDDYLAVGIARKRHHGRPVAQAKLAPCWVASAPGCGAFYRTKVLRNLGGFPEDFEAYFDDVDVGLRLRAAGYAIAFEPRSRILHHGHSSYGRRPARRVQVLQARNEERLFWRHVSPRQRAWAIPAHLVVLLAKAWKRWQADELRPFLQGRFQAWSELANPAARFTRPVGRTPNLPCGRG